MSEVKQPEPLRAQGKGESGKPRGLRERIATLLRFRLPTLQKNTEVILQLLPDEFATDMRDLGPTHICPCGCTVFETLVSFENYEISWWFLDGKCLNCANLVKLPCPVDNPERSE